MQIPNKNVDFLILIIYHFKKITCIALSLDITLKFRHAQSNDLSRHLIEQQRHAAQQAQQALADAQHSALLRAQPGVLGGFPTLSSNPSHLANQQLLMDPRNAHAARFHNVMLK